MLAAIPYNDNEVWLHTDASLMPRSRAAWASWNFLGRCLPPHVLSVKDLHAVFQARLLAVGCYNLMQETGQSRTHDSIPECTYGTQ